ncbi:MAG: DsbA family oxidoreductase [Gammaproteobacteria bacterium]
MLIEVFSDVICPWCYIGKRRLERALAADGTGDVEVRWRAYQLNPNIPPEGMDRAEYVRRRFGPGGMRPGIYDRIAAEGAREDIAFDFGAQKRMPNTLDAHRLIGFAADAAIQNALVEVLFRFNFCEGRDVGDREVLVQAAAQAGLDAGAARAHLEDPAAGRDAFEHDIATAREEEIAGVPTFVLQRRFAVQGAQEADTLRMLVQRARERLVD